MHSRTRPSKLAFISAVVAVISAIATFVEIRHLIRYKFWECVSDIALPIISAVLAGYITHMISTMIIRFFSLNSNLSSLAVNGITCIIVYLFLSIAFNMQGFEQIKQLFQKNLFWEKEHE